MKTYVNVMMAYYRIIPTLLVFIWTYSIEAMAISFARRPSNTTVLRGGTVELLCSFHNRGSSEVMWYRSSGTVIANKGGIVVNARPEAGMYSITGNKRQGEYNLMLTNAQLSDADEYSCGYNAANMTRILRAYLIVQTPPSSGFPRCSMEPTAPRVGDLVNFICTSEGGVPPAELRWNKNGHNRTTIETQMSIWRKTIRLQDLKAKFVCEAKSPVEDSPRTCEVHSIQIEPSIKIEPSVIDGFIGVGGTTVTCSRVDKATETDFRWYYNGRHISNLRDSNRFEVIGNGQQMEIKRLIKRDRGSTIKCELQIYKGLMLNASAVISVQGRFATEPNDISTQRLQETEYITNGVMWSEDGYGNIAGIISTPQFIIIILITSSLITVSLLCLFFAKFARNRRVDVNATTNVMQHNQTSGNVRMHIYETAFPVTLGEREHVITTGYDRATYHDIVDDGVTNTDHSNGGDAQGGNLKPFRYHKNQSPTSNGRIKSAENSQHKEIVYEVPGNTPSSPSDNVEIAHGTKSAEDYVTNHKSQWMASIAQRASEFPPVVLKPPKLVLRTSKSESNLLEESILNEFDKVTNKNNSATNVCTTIDKNKLPAQNLALKCGLKSGLPKTRRLSPTSPPPKTTVTRPKHIILKSKLNVSNESDYANDIRVSTRAAGKPPVALKPSLVSPRLNRTPSPGSPMVPPRPVDQSRLYHVDRDGYEIPKKSPKGAVGRHNQIDEDYEQVDQVVLTPPGRPYDDWGRNSSLSPVKEGASTCNAIGYFDINEYKSLERGSAECSCYQPLKSPPNGTAPPTALTLSCTHHEYETPPIFTGNKNQSVTKPLYLEILD